MYSARTRYLRSCPVADAASAPVLRDQGPIGRPGTARPMQAATPCLQSQIGQDRHLGNQRTTQLTATLVLSVAVRSGPVVTGVNGTLVARRTRTTFVGLAA